MSAEEREVWTLESDCQGVVDIKVCVKKLVDGTRRLVGYRVSSGLMGRVMDILAKAKLADKIDGDNYEVHFRKLRVATADAADEDQSEERRLDHVREGLIRAIARGGRIAASRGGGVRRRRKIDADRRQPNLL